MKKILMTLVILVTAILILPSAVDALSELQRIENSFLTNGLVNIRAVHPGVQVSLRYATPDNFLGRDVYDGLTNAYLQKEAAYMLSNAQEELSRRRPGCHLLVYDAARPRSVQRLMWNLVKGTPQQPYVANPARGSIHNFGCAVDLTILDEDGRPLDMGTPFDFFGDLAQPRLERKFLKEGKLTPGHLKSRQLLRDVMEAAGFQPIANEWWHFNAYPAGVVTNRYRIIE